MIVTPEYNHGYPGSLKAVLDLLLREYVHKSRCVRRRLGWSMGRHARDRSDGADGAVSWAWQFPSPI